MDKARGGQDHGWEVGIAGVRKSGGGGKWRQLYMHNNKKRGKNESSIFPFYNEQNDP